MPGMIRSSSQLALTRPQPSHSCRLHFAHNYRRMRCSVASTSSCAFLAGIFTCRCWPVWHKGRAFQTCLALGCLQIGCCRATSTLRNWEPCQHSPGCNQKTYGEVPNSPYSHRRLSYDGRCERRRHTCRAVPLRAIEQQAVLRWYTWPDRLPYGPTERADPNSITASWYVEEADVLRMDGALIFGWFPLSCSILCATIREKAFPRHILEQRLASHLVQHAPFCRGH